MKLQVDKKTTKQIRIDEGWHKALKIEAARQDRSIRELVEECLGDYFSLEDSEYLIQNKIRKAK